jgi:hypothetical protein
MERERAIAPRLRKAVDGYDIERGFGRACPGCAREHEPDDSLLVIAGRRSHAAEWNVESIICTECARRYLSDDERRPAIEQALLSATLAVAGMTLVVDGESARLLDRSPAGEQ